MVHTGLRTESRNRPPMVPINAGRVRYDVHEAQLHETSLLHFVVIC
jgi:hypothetical protein